MVRRQQFRQKIEGRNGGNTDVQQLLIFIGKFQNRFLLEIQDLNYAAEILNLQQKVPESLSAGDSGSQLRSCKGSALRA